jgi:hypothetical protein
VLSTSEVGPIFTSRPACKIIGAIGDALGPSRVVSHDHASHVALAEDGRGLVQMVFAGVVLALLVHGRVLVGALILLAAAVMAASRIKGVRARCCCSSLPAREW